MSIHLPLEIWGRILCYATHVPHLMDIDPPDPCDTPLVISARGTGGFPTVSHVPLVDNFPPKRAIYDAQRTKAAIALVCKSFHTYLGPELYTCLLVTNRNFRLLRSLEDSRFCAESADAGHFNVTLGSKVQHLVITSGAEFVEGGGHVKTPQGIDADLAAIVRCLPKLRILTMDVKAYYARRSEAFRGDLLAQAVVDTSAQTLQKIAFHGQARAFVGVTELENMFAACTNLRALVYSRPEDAWPRYAHPIPPVRLPPLQHISFLSIDGTSVLPLAGSGQTPFPSLHRAHLSISLDTLHWLDTWDSQFQFPTLTHFSLYIHGPHLRPETPLRIFEFLRKHFQKLTHLMLFADMTFLTQVLSRATLPSVAYLWLYDAGEDKPRTAWRKSPESLRLFLNTMARIESDCLRVVRLDTSLLEAMGRSVADGEDIGISQLSACTFAVEDCGGRSVVVELYNNRVTAPVNCLTSVICT
ncbi:hypothetical protein OF83DRAFT_1137522 [Amylostereum chailletii]|nr:hypothetical protein OF83DRAFT_1137522 [Amylostereum chailletii]